ncbi:Omp28-related outer membrane protein [candidate division WOR-3 bacterium]|nr:Omp28-related outer membrane protein [candidate division WOR-3 bacterium]
MYRRVFVLLMAAAAMASASHRVVVVEDFTATWCTYCPGAARGIEELQFRAFDSVVAIAYHSSSSDPFYTATANTRKNYYGVTGYPTCVLEGDSSVVGGIHTGTMFPVYWDYFRSHVGNPSQLDIGLTASYDSASRSGVLTVVVRNTGGSAVSGQLQVALTESHIPYPWQGMDSLHDLERTMLPDANGEAIAVPAGDSVVKTRNFTLGSAWVARNCRFVVFAQNNSGRAIYQGAACDVMQRSILDYYGYTGSPARPGEDVQLRPMLRNVGSATAVGTSAILSTTDPYVTVMTANAGYPDIGVAETREPNSPLEVHIDAGCPSDHVATLALQFTSSDGGFGTTTFPMLVTVGSGLSDDVEHGANGWTTSGINCRWAQTTTRAHSPTRSWGTTLSGQYPNETDMRLVSPYILVGDAGQLRFYQWYAVEQGWDYCMVDVNMGGPFWNTLASYTGSAQTWTLQTFDLAPYIGSTLRLRFRFLSDGSVTDQGWFVDDVVVSPYVTGISEAPPVSGLRLGPAANPVRDVAKMRLFLPAGVAGSAAIYDAGGRLVRRLADVPARGSGHVGLLTWDLKDAAGRRVRNGTYFARLTAARTVTTTSLVVVR